jgi:hypothetical protein
MGFLAGRIEKKRVLHNRGQAGGDFGGPAWWNRGARITRREVAYALADG